MKQPPFHPSLRSLVVLVSWTLLVWAGRLRNVVASDFEGFDRTWRFGVAALFVLLAGLVGVGLAARLNWSAVIGGVLAVVGLVWWLVRGTGTLFGDYSAGFKVVHTVLSVGTVVVSLWVLRPLIAHRQLRSLAVEQGGR